MKRVILSFNWFKDLILARYFFILPDFEIKQYLEKIKIISFWLVVLDYFEIYSLIIFVV